jgi:hypothetical protein
VTTAAFITGHSLGERRQRIVDACERGGSSIFGSGIITYADILSLPRGLVSLLSSLPGRQQNLAVVFGLA